MPSPPRENKKKKIKKILQTVNGRNTVLLEQQMADVLQDVGLESDFLQQLLSAGAEVALFYHLRAEKGAAVRTVGGGGGQGRSSSLPLQTPSLLFSHNN